MQKNIITLGITLDENKKRKLEAVGSLTQKESPTSVQDFLTKAEEADIIYSNGAYLLDSLPHLQNVFVTYPYVELGVFNSEELKQNGVQIANAQGGNRDSIVEWVMYMVLELLRKFRPLVRATENIDVQMQQSLQGKNVLIVGYGSIGSQVGKLCQAFGMNVVPFKRGDSLEELAAQADIIINALNCNTSSKNLLNEQFFMNVKKGSHYITFARPYTYDIDALISSIDNGILAGAAIDCDPEKFGDTTNAFYQKSLSCPKILVTPHIAFSTTQAIQNGGEIAIKNIEAYIKGEPQNILQKK